MIGISNDETNFPHKLLLANTQVSKIRKVLANRSSANTKFSKTQFPKILQLGGFIPGPPMLPDIPSLTNPIIHSFVKELINTGTKKINKDIIVDAVLVKRLHKKFHQPKIQEQL